MNTKSSGSLWLESLAHYQRNMHPMIYLHKILPTFVLPIMFVIIVILIGLVKNKKKLIYIAIGGNYRIRRRKQREMC